MKWLPGAQLQAALGKVRDVLWPFYILLVQYHRAGIQASGITITVLAGVYSIAIPILYPVLTQGLTAIRLTGIVLVLIVASYVLIVVSGGTALRTADPETNARILLAGRPAKEVLFTIARRIDRSCRRTLKYSTWAEDILKELVPALDSSASVSKALSMEPWRRRKRDRFIRWISLRTFRLWARSSTSETPDQVRDEIECYLWWLRCFPRKQHTALQRIEVMKYRASEELDIPPRRLCDHLFQYSPAIHRDRLAKYVQNWEEILDLRQMGRKVDAQRLHEKAEQNLLFIHNTRRRRKYQHQILENRDLHSYIVHFASMHSTSGSLQIYADALRFVAMVGSRNLKQVRGKAARDREARRIEVRFAFLHRKQRAHPGFDLHTLLLRALGQIKEPSLGGAKDLLEKLHQFHSTDDSESEAPSTISTEKLNSFRYLSFHLANLVSDNRKEICARFGDLYKAWLPDLYKIRPPEIYGDHYIVSHGYSRTVLSVLKHNFCRQQTDSSNPEPQPRFFFILPDPKDSLDTRVMEYELKEDWYPSPFKVAAGTEDHLFGLINKRPVLVLLGAECFDGDRRMVHPRGGGNGLRKLLNDLKERKLRHLVAVVSESYKLHDNSLTADSTFFGQHFDRIDLYPPDLIHLVITDKVWHPSNWEEVVENRRPKSPPPPPDPRPTDASGLPA